MGDRIRLGARRRRRPSLISLKKCGRSRNCSRSCVECWPGRSSDWGTTLRWRRDCDALSPRGRLRWSRHAASPAQPRQFKVEDERAGNGPSPMPLVSITAAEAFGRRKANRRSIWPDGRNDRVRLNGIAQVACEPSFSLVSGEAVFTVGSCFARNIEARLAEAWVRSARPAPFLTAGGAGKRHRQ